MNPVRPECFDLPLEQAPAVYGTVAEAALEDAARFGVHFSRRWFEPELVLEPPPLLMGADPES